MMQNKLQKIQLYPYNTMRNPNQFHYKPTFNTRFLKRAKPNQDQEVYGLSGPFQVRDISRFAADPGSESGFHACLYSPISCYR